jgi:Acyl-CoA dehydrogenase, N-terminal domain
VVQCAVLVVGGQSMQWDIFTSDHEAFRGAVRSFIAKEVAPYHEQWERDGAATTTATTSSSTRRWRGLARSR